MIDRQSETFLEIEKRINSSLCRYRKKLEITGVSIQETEYLRGQINALSSILSADNEDVMLSANKDIYL